MILLIRLQSGLEFLVYLFISMMLRFLRVLGIELDVLLRLIKIPCNMNKASMLGCVLLLTCPNHWFPCSVWKGRNVKWSTRDSICYVRFVVDMDTIRKDAQ